MLAALLALAAALAPGAPAAQPRVPLIAVLIHGTEATQRPRVDDLREGLLELGYREGSDYRLEVRFTGNHTERLPELAESAEQLPQLAERCRQERCEALVALLDPNLASLRAELVALAATLRIPAVYSGSLFVEAGGLISYGADTRQLYRRAATYVDKILKGAKPGELAIEQPTKFELVVNLATAKALGIRLPQELLLRADRVIE